MSGRLVLVGTPIGNLGDLSPRAVEVLAAADVVCCEDTRHSRKLLSHAGLRPARLVAVHEHNEREQADLVVRWLEEGKVVAVITDAGLPGISDPGAQLGLAAAADDRHDPVADREARGAVPASDDLPGQLQAGDVLG